MSKKYVDLTPVNTADSEGHYAEAIKIALDNNNVTNIALTGSYGSGKSSIINSFEKKFSFPLPSFKEKLKTFLRFSSSDNKGDKKSVYNFMNISLASFSEKKEDTSDILIERSILQQMTYGISSRKIPLSRFKTITKDKLEDCKSYFFITWLLTTIIFVSTLSIGLFSKFIAIASLAGWGITTFSLSGLILYSINVYRHINRKSFKKVNVKSGEIELGEQSKNSILNRYLDEILYFFQCNTFDVVVFEDLDRFGSSEIFVKLREINTLINKSEDINRRVVFLYAIKDEMFAHKERAKFFDFIIPVIPIINCSNSYEKLQERLPDTKYSNMNIGRLDQDFLKEVSIYIDDMRLLNNIVNEMNLYYSVLFSDHIKPSKLLALIIYKNVYPEDFSKLHENRGLVYECCNNRNKLIEFHTASLLSNIEIVNGKLQFIYNQIQQQKSMSILDLNSIYIHKIIEQDYGHDYSVNINGSFVELEKLKVEDNFNALLDIDDITVKFIRNNHWVNRSLNMSFNDIENKVNSEFSYLERKNLILGNKTAQQEKLEEEKANLIKQKSELVKLSQYKLLQKGSDFSLFSKDGYADDSSYNLLRYLLRNGHIDEYYQDHISHFYDGRLSHNDMNFIKAVRDFRPSSLTLQLTYIEEIIKNRLRENDFKEKYIFNISLLDYLVKYKKAHKHKLTLLLENISNNIESLWDFLLVFIDATRSVERFIQLLSQQWPNYASTITESNEINASQKSYLLKLILLHVESEFIYKYMNSEETFTNYLAVNPESILDLQPAEQMQVYYKLTDLNIKFKELEECAGDDKLLSHIFDQSLYEITSENICLILKKLNKQQDEIEKSNLSVIYNSNIENFICYIEDNIETYINKVFLALPVNREESEETIIKLLNNPAISSETKEKIIKKQNHVFESLSNIPSVFWKLLLVESKLEINWGNLAEFNNEFPDDKSQLFEVLNQKAQCLSILKINKDSKFEESISEIIQMILVDDLINNAAFALLIKGLPYKYKTLNRYDIPKEKMEALLTENLLSLSETNYSSLTEHHPELVGLFIFNNLSDYWNKSNEYELSPDTSLFLLNAITSLVDQVALVKLLNEGNLEDNHNLANNILHILSKVTDLKQFEESLLYIAIKHSTGKNQAITLFLKLINTFNKEEITDLLKSMGQPYSQIASFKNNPNLVNNRLHKDLAIALEDCGYISSQKIKDNKIAIYTRRS
ncbi:hypothetical protein I6E85_00730 [Pseudoalteromonas sp. NZS71]|uniref:YobI family P-loop NTPase n=1 Tax=unclassified Pseudoalteromonas TaxID=194690 RepID=UPI0003FA6BE8|nr:MULTISPECIES: hypothetical protein [unclassified Pseudoalteromonas]MBH0059672.1 hypothetical protein [Pseudoalteromonas sp. NZS71]